jgi:hypothetical protein
MAGSLWGVNTVLGKFNTPLKAKTHGYDVMDRMPLKTWYEYREENSRFGAL